MAAKCREQLDELQITTIVSIGGGPQIFGELNHLHIGLRDNRDDPRIEKAMIEAADFIETALNNGERVLVHCQAGMSRSPAFVAAFLILKRGMRMPNVLEFVAQQRPSIRIAKPLVKFLENIDQAVHCPSPPPSIVRGDDDHLTTTAINQKPNTHE